MKQKNVSVNVCDNFLKFPGAKSYKTILENIY